MTVLFIRENVDNYGWPLNGNILAGEFHLLSFESNCVGMSCRPPRNMTP